MSLQQPSLLPPPSPALSDLLGKQSACARLARLFLSQRGQWIDSDQIARVAGKCAWRTRCSNLRKAPWHFQIDNRVRTVTENGRTFKVSEYKLG